MGSTRRIAGMRAPDVYCLLDLESSGDVDAFHIPQAKPG